jgi:negative regulator of flagellin synthesis FlgM
MKISQPSDNPVAVSSNAASLSAKSGPVAGAPVKTGAVKSTPSAGVAVTFSPMARSLEASGQGETPDVDMTKVESVRSAIAQGTYVVNPGVIADKLLGNAQEMLQRSRV